MKTIESISYIVPIDVMIDIAQVILQAEIKHSLSDIKKGRNAIVLDLTITPNQGRAKENIESILSDYNYYRYGIQNIEADEE